MSSEHLKSWWNKNVCAAIVVKGEKWETVLMKSLFSHNACFFIVFMIHS